MPERINAGAEFSRVMSDESYRQWRRWSGVEARNNGLQVERTYDPTNGLIRVKTGPIGRTLEIDPVDSLIVAKIEIPIEKWELTSWIESGKPWLRMFVTEKTPKPQIATSYAQMHVERSLVSLTLLGNHKITRADLEAMTGRYGLIYNAALKMDFNPGS